MYIYIYIYILESEKKVKYMELNKKIIKMEYKNMLQKGQLPLKWNN